MTDDNELCKETIVRLHLRSYHVCGLCCGAGVAVAGRATGQLLVCCGRNSSVCQGVGGG